jgi:mono/diheme cytochrome c family protein
MPVAVRPEHMRKRGDAAIPWVLLLTWLVSGCASGSPIPPESAELPARRAGTPAEPAAPFFTTEQAARGQRTFTTVCAVCHGRNEFTGPIFALTWMEEPVGHLFEHISTAMPQDDPGSLAPEEYAAIVAYLLQLNGRAAGERELPADAELLGGLRW